MREALYSGVQGEEEEGGVNGRCESCVHWRATDEDETEGICRLITEGGRLGVAGRDDAYEFSSKLAFVAVGDRRHIDCKLRTASTFGCIQHEPK